MQASLTHGSLPLTTKPTPLQSSLSRFKRRVLQLPGELWDHPDGQDLWVTLREPFQPARFQACATLLRRHAPAGSVLEIGCGEGLLMQHLDPSDYASWLGVDNSHVAIECARKFHIDHVRYAVGDTSKFEPGADYDAIVFPDSIHDASDPAEVLKRYARHLRPGGVFVISILEKDQNVPVWLKYHSVAYAIDFTQAKNDHGAWTCEMLRMR